MKLIRRQVKLMNTMNENPGFGLRELSEMLGVSTQTVKADLQNLAPFMQDYGVKAEILPGNQLRIEGMENIAYLLKSSSLMMEFSLEKQVQLILLLQSDFMVLQDIADRLYVSKSLVEKVMAALLKQYPEELQATRHYGIRNIASDMKKRSRFVELLEPYLQGIDFEEELRQFHNNHFPLLEYIQSEEIARAEDVIDYLQSVQSFSFTDESIRQLFLHLLYIQLEHRLPFATKVEKQIERTDFGKLVDGMQEIGAYQPVAAEACKLLGLPNRQEEAYLCYLFMLLRKQSISDYAKVVEKMKVVVSDIFQKISERMSIDFSRDQELLYGLSVHIYTTVLRQNQLKTCSLDYSWADIRHQYPLGFEMAVIAAEVILQKFNYHISEDEMTYLSLHFQAGIERMKNGEKKIQVLVVCHYGMAAANLIAAKLERIFQAVRITDTISMQRFLQMEDSPADLIVSTETIHTAKLPVIYVTPILASTELKQISRFIETHCINNLLALAVLHAKVIDLEQAVSKEEVIETAVGELSQNHMVSEDYLESIIQRENLSSTDVGAIAIPHGNPDFVNETQLVILRLKKPVHWSVSDVSYVFLFAVSKEQFTSNFALFSSFYKKLVRSNMRNEIKKFGQADEQEFKSSLAHLLSI